MIRYLSLSDIAKRWGLRRTSMPSYKLPEPDAMVGTTRGWLEETIAEHEATKPGPGRPPKSKSE